MGNRMKMGETENKCENGRNRRIKMGEVGNNCESERIGKQNENARGGKHQKLVTSEIVT